MTTPAMSVTTIALDPARNLINGQPGTLARYIDEMAIHPGERAFHVGCGVGYYTAILAEVTGPGGQVVATEVDRGPGGAHEGKSGAYANA
jgi:protein-L-isoaspartate(D-aspartate) O-methyltransferase